jgi:hypothetical protein
MEGGKARLSRSGRTYDWHNFSDLRVRLTDHEESLNAICDVYVDKLVELLKTGI